MNPFDNLCNEEIHLRHKDGRQSGPHKASFSKSKFTIFDGSLDVEEGDIIDRPLPNGKAERYDVIKVNYTHKFHAIPAHVDMTVRKQGELVPFEKPRVMNVTINNSQGFQIGDHNTQNIVKSFNEVIRLIESSSATAEEKTEAKSRMKAFLEHPLTSAIVGGAVGGLTGMLK